MSKNVVEKLSTRGIFEDDTNILIRLNDIEETDNVGMFECLEIDC